jgi:alkanesulfonate monooxygenase SsuD/methylene tetrahydromethanopterin reductase-like flavin-dependent oxidoreductase (luciferase family)
MRFGFVTGGSSAELRHDVRYWEVLEEVELADELGFDVFGAPEQHFLGEYCSTSAAECFYGAVAMRTNRIHIRSCITLLPVNHPIRVAEQAATLDILSRGRYEIGTGRSNNPLQLEPFGITAQETRARWVEALEVIVKAFTQDPFSHEGHYFKIPPRSLIPKPVQKPHPPLFVASSGIETHKIAGKKGIGLMSFSNYLGFAELEKYIQAYKENIRAAKPVGAYITNSVGVLVVPGHCAETTQEARQEIKERAAAFTALVDVVYPELAKASSDYAYMGDVAEKIQDKIKDMDYLAEESAGVVIGDPDACVRQIKKFEAIGVQEMLLGVDGIPHDKIMKSLELFGKYVIPQFKRISAYP